MSLADSQGWFRIDGTLPILDSRVVDSVNRFVKDLRGRSYRDCFPSRLKWRSESRVFRGSGGTKADDRGKTIGGSAWNEHRPSGLSSASRPALGVRASADPVRSDAVGVEHPGPLRARADRAGSSRRTVGDRSRGRDSDHRPVGPQGASGASPSPDRPAVHRDRPDRLGSRPFTPARRAVPGGSGCLARSPRRPRPRRPPQDSPPRQ